MAIISYCPAEFQAVEHESWPAGVNREGRQYGAGERWSLHVLCEGSPGSDVIELDREAVTQVQGFKRGDAIVVTLTKGKYRTTGTHVAPAVGSDVRPVAAAAK